MVDLETAIQKARSYKYIGFSPEGQKTCSIGFNNSQVDVETRINEIKQFYAQDMALPGKVYEIRVKNSLKQEPFQIKIKPVNLDQIPLKSDPVHTLAERTNSVPFDQYTKLLDQVTEIKIRNAELESENRILLERIEDLKIELDAQDQELDQEDLSQQGGMNDVKNVLMMKLLQNSDAIMEKFLGIKNPLNSQSNE